MSDCQHRKATFRDNFGSEVEYFSLNDDGEIMPIGTVYDYVVPAFINAFVNYVTPVRAYLVTNYEREPGTNARDAAVFSERRHPHTDIRTMFSDDIVMLAKDAAGLWWYFFFDRGARGSVGRFRSAKSSDVLSREFEEHAKEMGPVTELPVSGFVGWITT